ncbi:hypothetical protein DFH09DRAFT_1094045 [Mycena vulgaris]|nr:hypothetical protein DFH09DRAFT_1094045 [Mycena vulgaris]
MPVIPEPLFKNCTNFTITGGAFGVTPQSRPMPSGSLFDLTLQSRSPPNFHSIRTGDLNLLTEIGVERIVRIDEVRHRKTGHLVQLRPRVVGTRRIHRALVTRRGIKEILTAVVYEGLNVDEASFFLWAIDEWHPSLVQLYAVVMSPGMNALIYTDGCVKISGPSERSENSTHGHRSLRHTSSTELSGICLYARRSEFRPRLIHVQMAFKYWEHTTGVSLMSPQAPNYTAWIRLSTGRLCIDVGDSFPDIKHLDLKSYVGDPVSRASGIGYCEGGLAEKLISCLELDDIHVLLCSSASYESMQATFRVGRVGLGEIWSASNLAQVIDSPSAHLSLPQLVTLDDVIEQPWWNWNNGLRTQCDPRDVMANGWTRFALPRNMQNAHHLTTRVKIEPSKRREIQRCWLAQANSVARHRTPINYSMNSYYLPAEIKFRVSIWYPDDSFNLRGTFMSDTPAQDIYLFLFKPRVEVVDGYPVVQIPRADEAFYWSLDPRGKAKLSSEKVEDLGVPCVFFESWITGASWSQRDYDTLADVHFAKGAHPFSSDVAICLDYPLVKQQTNTVLSGSESRVSVQTVANSVQVDSNEVESAKRALRTYPEPAFSSRCRSCGRKHPTGQNVVLPSVEVPPIHRHRKYRNVFVRANATGMR